MTKLSLLLILLAGCVTDDTPNIPPPSNPGGSGSGTGPAGPGSGAGSVGGDPADLAPVTPLVVATNGVFTAN